MLNHRSYSKAVACYIDPRILAAFCVKYNIQQSELNKDIFFYNMEYRWAINSMWEYKNYRF